jgi:glycosyltransferase involved in cell wall biosynthesis
MNIVITGTGFSFPDGTGATARVMAIAKGLAHHGATVHVFVPKPSQTVASGASDLNLKGVYEGIPFEYACGQRLIAKTRAGALFLYVKGLWRTCRAVRRIHREKPVDAILVWYAVYPLNFLTFGMLAKSIGTVLIAEQSEFPFVYFPKTIAVRMKMCFNEHVTYKLLNGIIVISTYLYEYFAAHVKTPDKILQVPILVEPRFFEQSDSPHENKERKIIFCGNLEHEGEVPELLRAFGLVAAEFPLWRLEVIGPLPRRHVMAGLQTLVEELGLMGRVDFTGAMARAAIPARLSAGNIMALPRAAGTFSTAGFPTKLAEYLATGKPVVVTNTGDISQYLQDGVSAFLVPPNDTAAFARALRYVMLNPELAAEVGCRGRRVAECQFSSHLHCARVIDFISGLRR